MQYYYECLEIYDKLVPEVKNHCKAIRKCDAEYLTIRNQLNKAAEEFHSLSDTLNDAQYQAHHDLLTRGARTLAEIANQKRFQVMSLIISIDFYLAKLMGYDREFRCEVDLETPGTSVELDKKFQEANMKFLKDLQSVKEEYDFFDKMFKIPTVEPDSENLEDAEQNAMKANGGIRNFLLEKMKSTFSFQEDQVVPPGGRGRSPSTGTLKRGQASLKLKTERRISMTGPTPSPRAMSPRSAKNVRVNDLLVNIPSEHNTSSSVSPLASPSPQGVYSPGVEAFSTMPSFSGSQESRHGRQRKFTAKAQMMFKEKQGPGRPAAHQHLMPQPNMPLHEADVYPPQQNAYHPAPTQQQQQPQHPPHLPHRVQSQGSLSAAYMTPDFNRMAQSDQYAQPHPPSQQQQQQQQQMVYQNQYLNNQTHIPSMPNQVRMPVQYQQRPITTPQQYESNHNEPPSPGSNGQETEYVQEEDDDRSYCFCGERSYGEMVMCENNECPYVWFHFTCIGLTRRPRGRWVCPSCQNATPTES